MAMWLVSLNRKKKGHDNHAPERVEKVRFILQNRENSTYCKNRVGLISVAHQAH
ncbi:4'-phosphopantetheinyl transferase entD [Escherichia coli O25b:H4]|nr:4'-phosphopantetheinyl transferase entD [Escherichia coli O25b:H4]